MILRLYPINRPSFSGSDSYTGSFRFSLLINITPYFVSVIGSAYIFAQCTDANPFDVWLGILYAIYSMPLLFAQRTTDHQYNGTHKSRIFSSQFFHPIKINMCPASIVAVMHEDSIKRPAQLALVAVLVDTKLALFVCVYGDGIQIIRCD